MKTELTLTDAFWKRYTELIRHEMIPYQWDVLNDKADIVIDKERNDQGIPSEKSNAIENLKIAAGQAEGPHYGWLFQDSDVYKWLESAANSYKLSPDDQLLEMMNELAELIEEAQDEDGYLSTYYQIERPDLRFKRLFESHELYCAGHLIEASVAFYKATGNDRLLTVSEKFVTCIKAHFGSEEGKINGADGHQEIELALVKLYEVTHNKDYIDLSAWFLTIRGQDPDFYIKQLKDNSSKGLNEGPIPRVDTKYLQAYKPVLEQEEAVGHAVRLMYMAAAMAEISSIHKDEKMFKAARRLWDNIIKKRFYITGGVGSTVHGEAFTFDYDLPNDTMYCETCASIGLLFFAKAMLRNKIDVEYAEVMERTLYNSIISGMALDGKHFFYVNPLEVDPKASQLDPGKSHVKATRPSWFGCACCPPNIARTLTSLNHYITDTVKDRIYVHLYADFEGDFNINGQSVSLKLETTLPYKGKSKIQISGVKESVELCLRLPEWASSYELSNKQLKVSEKEGYLSIVITEDGSFELNFEMAIIQWAAHPLVKENTNKIALQRGPFVYCLEEEDNGEHLHLLSLFSDVKEVDRSDELGDYVALVASGERKLVSDEWENHLYLKDSSDLVEDAELTFIPYHLWANRSVGEMRVWVTKKSI